MSSTGHVTFQELMHLANEIFISAIPLSLLYFLHACVCINTHVIQLYMSHKLTRSTYSQRSLDNYASFIFRQMLYDETVAKVYRTRQNIAANVEALKERLSFHAAIDETVISSVKAERNQEIQKENAYLSNMVNILDVRI